MNGWVRDRLRFGDFPFEGCLLSLEFEQAASRCIGDNTLLDCGKNGGEFFLNLFEFVLRPMTFSSIRGRSGGNLEVELLDELFDRSGCNELFLQTIQNQMFEGAAF